MKYKFHSFAAEELEISADWYSKKSTVQSKRFVKQVFETVDFI